MGSGYQRQLTHAPRVLQEHLAPTYYMGLNCARPHPLFDPLFELSFWFPLLLPLRLPSLFCPFCCPLLLPANIQSDEERRVQERLPRIMSVLRQVISALLRQHCCGIRHLSKDWHSLMPSR